MTTARPLAAPALPDADGGLVGILSRSLERQTDAIVASLADLRAEVRTAGESTRRSLVAVAVVAILAVAGVVGVSIRFTAPGVSVESGPPSAVDVAGP